MMRSIYRYRHGHSVHRLYLLRKAEKYRRVATAINDVDEALTNWLALLPRGRQSRRVP